MDSSDIQQFESILLNTLTKNQKDLVFYKMQINADWSKKFLYITDNIYQITGITSNEIKNNYNLLFDTIVEEHQVGLLEIANETLPKNLPYSYNVKIINRRNNEVKWLQLSSTNLIEENEKVVVYGTAIDITKEQEAKIVLEKTNRELNLLNNATDVLFTNFNQQNLLQAICEFLVKEGGYALAIITEMPNINEINSLQILAKFGLIEYLEKLKINNDSSTYTALDTTFKMLIEKKVFVSNNLQELSEERPWHKASKEFNISSSIALLVELEENKNGILNIYSRNEKAFDENEVSTLKRIVQNINLRLKTFEIREALEKKSYSLNERNKELQVFYSVSQIFQENPLAFEENVSKVAQLIPTGMQFSEHCKAKIFFNNKTYGYPKFDETNFISKHREEMLFSQNNLFGFIELGYILNDEIKDKYATELFLPEENKMIKTVIKIIGDFYERFLMTEELHTTAANLETIFNHTSIGYALLDLNYNIVSCNKILQDNYGNNMNIIFKVGDNILNDISYERREVKRTAFEKVLQTKESIEYEMYHENDEDEDKYFNIQVNPILDKLKNVIGLCLAMNDITEKKKKEIESIKISNELVRRNRELEHFSYIVSHNVRAPLANILGLNEIFKNNKLTKEQEIEIINAIGVSAKALDDVVQDVSKILQIRFLNAEVKEELCFEEIVSTILKSIAKTIEDKKAIIKIDFSAIKNYSSFKSFIVSVFQNLIVNALKYSKENTIPEIFIWSEIKNNKVQIHFKDNGIGLDLSKYKNQLFGMYKRFHSHVDGKGLGLYMVKMQLHTLGGNILVKSKPNEGAEFIVYLPL